VVGLAVVMVSSTVFGSRVDAHSASTGPGPKRSTSAATPVPFVANIGQAPPMIRYLAQGSGYSISFSAARVLVALGRGSSNGGASVDRERPRTGVAVGVRFVGADPDVRIEARDRLPGVVNYLVGSDPSRWRRGVPTYGEVVYHDLWPAVDAVFHGGNSQLDYEFVVRPGGRLSDIRFAYEGANGVSAGDDARRVLRTPAGPIRGAPVTFELLGGRRADIAGSFNVSPNGDAVGFTVDGAYDRDRSLAIDSALEYSTYLGGSELTEARGIAVDHDGHAYVTGSASVGFPTTPGAFDASPTGGDAYVAKVNSDGTALLYSTFLGGAGFDEGLALAVDDRGGAVVTGTTQSPDFPTTPGADDRLFSGDGTDAFVVELNRTGSDLVYSTLIGGSGDELGTAIALDRQHRAYVVGATSSTDFPATPGAFDETFNGGFFDGFAARLDRRGAKVQYATYLGGSQDDEGRGLAVDEGGHAYVAGQTGSADFPSTATAFDRRLNGPTDGFVLKLSPDGEDVAYATYVGGDDVELVAPQQALAIDQQGNAFVVGATASSDYPTTRGAYAPRLNGPSDTYVTKLNSRGSGLLYSTFIGGASFDDGTAIAVDSAERAHLIGITDSRDFPTTANAFDTTLDGARDAYVAVLNRTGGGLAYSTFLGGAEDITTEKEGELGRGIALDPGGGVHVAGDTDSVDFPTSSGAIARRLHGIRDAFVAKLDIDLDSGHGRGRLALGGS
jgi:hypothetical protein